VDILSLDDQLLVVNKPPGVLAQPDHTGDADVVTLGKERLAEDAGEPFLGPVHRLDRPASGVTVLARTTKAARRLSAQFRDRLVEKRYLVLVEGRLRGIGTWTDHVAKPGREPTLVAADHPEGKRAVLSWQALEAESDRTLLQVDLETGRPHQIRLQASHRGHPVVGDHRHGAQSSLETQAIALHHAVLRVDHPVTSRRETFVAPPPAVWESATSEPMDAAVQRTLAHAVPPDGSGS